jgi:ankyrin repeat protein
VQEGNTALMVAAAFNRTDVVRVLLDQGADASIANKVTCSTCELGYVCLSYYVWSYLEKEGLTARQLAADFPETAEVRSLHSFPSYLDLPAIMLCVHSGTRRS